MLRAVNNAINILALTLMCAFAALSTWVVLEFWARVPPVHYQDVRLATSGKIFPSTEIIIEYLQVRNRPCPSDIYGWWIDVQTNIADVRLPLVHGGYSPVSAEPYWQPVKLVSPPREGEWIYKSNIISFCSDRTYIQVTPPVKVVVVTKEELD